MALLDPAIAEQTRPRLHELWELTGYDPLRRLADGLHPYPDLVRDGAVATDLPPEQFPDWLGTVLMDSYKHSARRRVLSVLFEVHQQAFRRLLRVHAHRLGARVDLDDTLQEFVLNLMRYPHNFSVSKPDSFRVWVSTVLRNTLLKQLKRATRTQRVASLESEIGVEEPMIADPRARSPLGRVSDSETARTADRAYILWLALYYAHYESLSERERRALALVEIEGWSYRDTAADLGVKLENVKMVIFRARRKILRGLTTSLARLDRASADFDRSRPVADASVGNGPSSSGSRAAPARSLGSDVTSKRA